MLTDFTPKNAEKYYCKNCDFRCSKKSDWSRHLTTAKHKKLTNLTNFTPKIAAPNMHTCEVCSKQYKSRMGLWGHKKKCISQPKPELTADTKQTNKSMLSHANDNNAMMELLKQNQEFKELLIEQQQENQELQKQLIEAVKVGQHIENQTNINNNNQKFNLNFFLNEQCKDAINMSDFLENMELDLEDLTETGRLGYVGGISRILVNKLQELDVYKRPMHCTDVKRETLYIKENNEWEKQANSKEKMSKIIGQVANKNCRNIHQWTKQHPGYEVFDSPENMEYMNMTQAILGGFSEEENRHYRDKIVRNVVKEIVVGK